MSTNGIRKLELLAPARNADIAIEAIRHGADAVYIGGPAFGARKNACNSMDDIRRVADFAHIFRAKVYVTLNTIIYDRELKEAERTICKLWQAGIDALIVQDMGILRLDIPPVPLHASTQCDNRSIEKVKFLEQCGFSQIVLARELSIDSIREICNNVSAPIECFVHGALCVCYSGRCYASQVVAGRSANRGECAQLCRLPYDLVDSEGKILERQKHLLSLKDFNTSDRLADLVDAGVSSFKIEGRLKDASYVKNVTAAYSEALNKIISANPGKYARSSYGRTDLDFRPRLDKSFNRGFTRYFLFEKMPEEITSPLTPKSMGEVITDTKVLNKGDGISFFDKNRNYSGALVNGIDGKGRLRLSDNSRIPEGAQIHRTSDIQWEKMMNRSTAERKIWVDMRIDGKGISAKDEREMNIRVDLPEHLEIANKPQDYRTYFEKLGNTPYRLRNFTNGLEEDLFIPASVVTSLRRRVVSLLDVANQSTYIQELRKPENPEAEYVSTNLKFDENVANVKASEFYRSHGVKEIERALETTGVKGSDIRIMTTRHCILRETGRCRRLSGFRLHEPLYLTTKTRKFRLHFDCEKCEMQIYTI